MHIYIYILCVCNLITKNVYLNGLTYYKNIAHRIIYIYIYIYIYKFFDATSGKR